jgi:hypothetical protein
LRKDAGIDPGFSSAFQSAHFPKCCNLSLQRS